MKYLSLMDLYFRGYTCVKGIQLFIQIYKQIRATQTTPKP